MCSGDAISERRVPTSSSFNQLSNRASSSSVTGVVMTTPAALLSLEVSLIFSSNLTSSHTPRLSLLDDTLSRPLRLDIESFNRPVCISIREGRSPPLPTGSISGISSIPSNSLSTSSLVVGMVSMGGGGGGGGGALAEGRGTS